MTAPWLESWDFAPSGRAGSKPRAILDRSVMRSLVVVFLLAGVLNVSPTWILVGRGEGPLVDEDTVSDENPQGLLRLRESIQGKIDELKRIMAEVDDMIEKRAGGL